MFLLIARVYYSNQGLKLSLPPLCRAIVHVVAQTAAENKCDCTANRVKLYCFLRTTHIYTFASIYIYMQYKHIYKIEI